MYTITTPSGRKMGPPPGRCWCQLEENYNQLLADNRLWFGKNGNGVPRKKTFLSETEGVSPWTWWTNKEVGDNQKAKKESNSLFGAKNAFETPKPEGLLQRILHIASDEGDIVLDSFLGSGTTAAVAHKMNRAYIGIEMGNQAYSHSKKRMDKVIANEDQGGISSISNWKGGGGYRFFELAPSLLDEDEYGQKVINPLYDANKLAAAIALHEGFKYEPNQEVFWKQSKGNENSFLFVTTEYLSENLLNRIHSEMKEEEFLIIASTSYKTGIEKKYKNIRVKKIPQMILDKCEFSRENYKLNIISPPTYGDEEYLGEEDCYED